MNADKTYPTIAPGKTVAEIRRQAAIENMFVPTVSFGNLLALCDEIERLQAVNAQLLEALARIADMRDRDGNDIEMHRDELRGVARTAIAKAGGKS